MREIGIIAEEKLARVLEDYLLTLGISTKIVSAADGQHIWVHQEDRLTEARAVLEDFRVSPDDPQFVEAVRLARGLRKQTEQVDAVYRKNIRQVSDRWNGPMHKRAPVTACLVAITIVVAILTNLGSREGQLGRRAVHALQFSVSTFSLIDGDVTRVDHGFENIARGEFWRLITPIFIHIDGFHLLFNMAWLISLGDRIETAKGWKKLLTLVLLAAVLGNIGQFYEFGGNFGGMSGVVYALFGYVWAKGYSDPEDRLSMDRNTAVLMIAWFLFGIMSRPDVTPHPMMPRMLMGNAAHGVGLAVGVIFGLLRF